MTSGERAQFLQLKEAGVISFFRIAHCEQCDQEVIRGKRFCSERCHETHRLTEQAKAKEAQAQEEKDNGKL